MMNGYVYFIGNRDQDFVKIGFTNGDPRRRLAALQTGNPHKLELLLVVDGDLEWERAMHGWCAEERLEGEWFKLSGKVTTLIDALQSFYEAVDGTTGTERWWNV